MRYATELAKNKVKTEVFRINSTAVVLYAISLLILTKHNRRMEVNMTLCIYWLFVITGLTVGLHPRAPTGSSTPYFVTFYVGMSTNTDIESNSPVFHTRTIRPTLQKHKQYNIRVG